MKRIYMKLNDLAQAREFARVTSQFNADLVQGTYRVPTNSVLGIFSLDLCSPFNVEVKDEDFDKFINACYQFNPVSVGK